MKQQNKLHKQRHRSKGRIDKEDGGRIDDFKERRKHQPDERKVDRRNHIKQLRAAKRVEATQSKRAGGKAPHLLVVVGLCGDATNAAAVCEAIAPPGVKFDDRADKRLAKMGTFWNGPLKRWVTLAPAPAGDIGRVLDLVRVADTVLLAVSATEPTTDFGVLCMTTIKAIGVASVAHLVVDLEQAPQKRRGDLKKAATHAALAEFPETRVHTLEANKDTATTIWQVANQKRKALSWRDGHPYLLAQDIQFVPATDGSGTGTLLVSGWTRGKALNVNDLVHLPALGACRLARVTAETDATVPSGAVMDAPRAALGCGTVLAVPHPELQQSLDSEVPLDPLAGEQTWPTDEEIEESRAHSRSSGAAAEGLAPPPEPTARLVRVPKGTSSYQASWIVDVVDFEGDAARAADEEGNDDGDEDGGSADGDGDAEMDDEYADAVDAESEDDGDGSGSGAHRDMLEEVEDDANDVEYDEIDPDDKERDRAKHYDDEMDVEEERAALEASAREESEFPDEVDTPRDIPAKIRFQKYRGLQSFRHSRWDPKEELPEDYARIFQFQSFLRTRKRVLSKDPGDGSPGWVASGTCVTLHVEGVPAEYFASIPDGLAFVVFGLLEHENRKSVLNFKLQMHPTYDVPIKSKEKLIFYTGLRRFVTQPIFSQHTVGDKHKFERFFQPGGVCVATTFAPIHYPPSPALVFRETADGGIRLVATGKLQSVDPDRMVIKRIRLAGHPFKIHARTATLRYMFFNPEDIHWFKSVELTTKYGRKGHIKESLGTHGHMKCTFDGPINAQDTVLMNLYKRVYPKFGTYEELGF